MPEESRKKLYNAISSQFDLGSFEEFDTKMNDKTSREKLYKAVSQSFDLGSFDEFETKITPTPPPTEPPIQKTGTYEPRNKVAEMLNQPTSQDIQREKRGIGEVPKEVPSGTKAPQMGVPVETAKKQVEAEVKAKENLSQEVAFMDVQKDAEAENLSTQQLFDKNAPDLLKYLPKDKVVEYELLAKEKKLTADKQMLIERMKATNNPNTLNELNKTKVEEFKTKVEREKLQEARKKGFDAEIEKLNALATQMDQEGKTGVAKELRKSILAAEGERDGYFKDPDAQIMKIYSANKVDMDEFQVPGNTPMERTKNYALILQKQIADLDKKMQGDGPQKDGGMIEGISKVFDDQYQFFSGKKAKLEAKLAQVAPIALLNQLPTRGTDGFFNTMTNRIAKELLPEQVMARPENLTFEDIGGIIESNKLSMALSNDLITKGAVGAVDLMTEETKAFSPKWWGDLTGTSLSMMPAFIFGNKVAGAMKVPVLFDKIAVALKAQKYGKYISPFVLPAEKGIEYAAAKPFLSDDLGEEASFLSGYLGQAISGPVGKALSSAPMQAMFNKLFGASAPIVYNQIKALGGRVSSGLGEYGEEVGNTLGPILETYMNEQDFGRLKKDLTEQFGKLEPNLELFIGSVVMGMAMGSGTGIGDASLNKGREVYATLTPNQQKTADEILKQFKDDLETSEVNAKRQEIAEGETAPKVEEVTEVDLQNKQAAIEVIQSPTTSIKEKAEAAKVVRDIEAKEREVAITEKALEKGPLEEGEVVKEELPQEIKNIDNERIAELEKEYKSIKLLYEDTQEETERKINRQTEILTELNKLDPELKALEEISPTTETPKAEPIEVKQEESTPKMDEVVAEEVVRETPMVEGFDFDKLFAEQEAETPEQKQKAIDDIREEEYQKSSFDKKWAGTYKEAKNKLVEQYNKAKQTKETWEQKSYKSAGGKSVFVGGELEGNDVSINSINEKRKNNNIKNAKNDMASAKKDLAQLGLSENEINDLLEPPTTQETPILKEEAKIETKIEETPQKVEEGVLAQFGDNTGESVTTLEKAIKNQLLMESGGPNKPFGVNVWTNENGEIKYVGNDVERTEGLTQSIFAFDVNNNLLIEKSVIKSKEAQQAVEKIFAPSQTSLSEQKSETKVETPKKENLKQQKPKTKAEIKAEKEAEIKDRLLDRLAAYNSLSTYQQNTQKNRDEIVDIIGVASKYNFKVFDANVKSTKQSKKYELFKDGKKQTRTKVATETTKATHEQIKVAERLIEKDMVTLWDGSPYTPHLDAVSYGITWQQIRKGEQDIKAGKVDSVPAKKLIEALNQIESDGIVNIVSGSGSMMQRDGYKLSEARQAMREIPELTDADIEEINANEESLAKEYDEWFNNLTEEEQLNILEENESRNQSDVERNVESRESQKDVPNEEDGAGGSAEEKVARQPKSIKDLYRINRELFGLDRLKALSSAIVMDRMIGTMANRANITKAEMYDKLNFVKESEKNLPQGVKMQVAAWHGSPYEFDKFTTEAMGTGEGAQLFGWGLYFTDQKSIGEWYAKTLSDKDFEYDGNKLSENTLSYLDIADPNAFDADYKSDILQLTKARSVNTENIKKRAKQAKTLVLSVIKNNEKLYKKSQSLYYKNTATLSELNDKEKQEARSFNKDQFALKRILVELNGLINAKNIVQTKWANVYKVSLHKGKTINQYDWLDWRNSLSQNTQEIIDKSGLLKGEDIKGFNGRELYEKLTTKLGSSEKASLFLLKNGIDGIKYPSGSLSGDFNYKNGTNYVVFDENAVSLEEVIKFQKNANKAQGAAMVSLDGQATIYALTDPNVSTPLHEMAHIFEHYLSDSEKQTVIKEAGTEGWTIETSEYFARGFEKYLSDGVAPTSGLQKIFDLFKKWLTDIYNGIKGSDIDIQLNQPMTELYDKMLETDTEQALKDTIAKELNKSANELGVFKVGSTKLWLSMAKLMGLYSKKGVTKFGDFIKATGYKATSVLKDLWDGITRKKSTPISKSVRNSKLKTLNARVLFYEALIGASPLADGQTQLDDIKNTIATYKTLAIHANKSEVQDVINAVDALSDLYIELSADLNTVKEKIASQAANGKKVIELQEKLSLGEEAIKFFADDILWQEKVQKEIEKAKGELPDEMNPYMQRDISIGRVENTISNMTQKLFGKRFGELKTNKKGDKALFERAAKDKVSKEDLDFFLYVQHAKERNARVEALTAMQKAEAIKEAQDKLTYFATLNQNDPYVQSRIKEANQALSEAQSMEIVTDGSGMTNEEADRFMQEFEKSGKVPKLEEYAKEYRETVIKPMIDLLEESELLDADQAKMLRTGMDEKTGVKFEHYVPLKVSEKALEDIVSTGRPTLIKPVKSIKGTSKYDYVKRNSIIAQSMLDFQAAAKVAEDNRVAQSLYKLVKENPNKKIWEIIEPFKDGEKIDKTSQADKDASIVVKVNGKLKYIKINHEGLRNSWKKHGRRKDRITNIIVNAIRTFYNFKRKTLTTYSPEFVLSNFPRDLQSSVFNSSGVDIPFLGKQIIGNIKFANTAAIKALAGNLDPNSEMGKLLDLYLSNGGKISWANYTTIEELNNDLQKLAERFKENKSLGYYGKDFFNKGVAAIGALNESVEIGTRLALFKALVDNGITPGKAASISKNMTVNFNKKGTATPILSALWLFSNAGIQDTYTGFKNFVKSPKTRRYAAYVMTTGLALPFAQRFLISALSGSDDEEKEYLQLLTEEDQTNYFVIPSGDKKFIRVSKTYGLMKLFFNSGQEIGEAMIDGEIEKHAANLLSTLYSTVDPITGSSENFESAISPTFVRPFVEVNFLNRKYNNSPVYPEDRYRG